MSAGLNGKTGELLRWVLGLVLVALVSYFTSLGAVQTRIAVLEERQTRSANDTQEIKGDVKRLLSAVSRLEAAQADQREPQAPPVHGRIFDR